MVLAVDDARRLAAVWRPRFVDEADFEVSWSRYMDSATVPDAQRLEVWLARDLSKSEVKHAGIVHEPLLPTSSRFRSSDCATCTGNRYVRCDVAIADPHFGKAFACPDCNGGHRSELLAPIADAGVVRTGNWCWRCGADELAAAGESCVNPAWHIPGGLLVANASLDSVLRKF